MYINRGGTLWSKRTCNINISINRSTPHPRVRPGIDVMKEITRTQTTRNTDTIATPKEGFECETNTVGRTTFSSETTKPDNPGIDTKGINAMLFPLPGIIDIVENLRL